MAQPGPIQRESAQPGNAPARRNWKAQDIALRLPNQLFVVLDLDETLRFKLLGTLPVDEGHDHAENAEHDEDDEDGLVDASNSRACNAAISSTSITFGSGVTKVELVPRWWQL